MPGLCSWEELSTATIGPMAGLSSFGTVPAVDGLVTSKGIRTVTFAASRRFWLVALTVLAVCAALVVLPRTASAEVPGGAISGLKAAPSGSDDDEGGSEALRKSLETAASGYVTAKNKVAASQKRQKTLVSQIARTESRLATLNATAQRLGAVAYTGGMPDPITVLANSGSMGQLVERESFVDTISRQTDETLRDLHSAQKRLTQQRSAVDKELATQQALAKTMAKRRADAEKALSDAGGGRSSAGFFSGTSAAATPAPRNSDGSWPTESCDIKDPTSDGCVTPRMLHVYNEARDDGFTHYTHCFRQASFGEHPKGRACDFAADVGGFGGIATGDSKTYGDRLAAWGVDNADRLGVLYVIWFKQIWLPGVGWKSYQGDGTPSGDHMNHVHISVQ
jgi:hypothetical protein